jgi:hypothetical protein
MTKEEAVLFFADLFNGEHHIPGRHRGDRNVIAHGYGWRVSGIDTLATWDSDLLTRAVFLAHDRCFRLEADTIGGRLSLVIWKRTPTPGDLPIALGHPTIEAALADWRKRHPGR